MALKTSLAFTIVADLTKAFDEAAGIVGHALARNYGFSDGAAANQANRIYQDKNTIAASGVFDYDLSGALLDVYGDAVVFARVRALVVAAADANTNNVLVGGVTNGLVTILSPAGSGTSPVPGSSRRTRWRPGWLPPASSCSASSTPTRITTACRPGPSAPSPPPGAGRRSPSRC